MLCRLVWLQYSSWYGAIRNNFKAVKVKLIESDDEDDDDDDGTRDIVQLLPEYVPVPVDDR